MEDIKNLFKKTIIVTIVCFLLGLVFQNKYLLFGISGGCAISVIALYMLSVDTKAIIYSKDMKKANYHNGFVYGGELGSLLNRKAWHWWQLAGASYQYTVDEVSKLLEEHIIPIFDDFEDTESNIEKFIDGDIIDHNLLYYIYHFGGKAKAQQYFNKIIEKDKLRSKYIGFYKHLKDLPKESILLDEGEFYGADMIKFAFINGLEIDK